MPDLAARVSLPSTLAGLLPPTATETATETLERLLREQGYELTTCATCGALATQEHDPAPATEPPTTEDTMSTTTPARTCADCGLDITDTHPRRQRCLPCGETRERTREVERQRRIREQQRQAAPPTERRSISIELEGRPATGAAPAPDPGGELEDLQAELRAATERAETAEAGAATLREALEGIAQHGCREAGDSIREYGGNEGTPHFRCDQLTGEELPREEWCEACVARQALASTTAGADLLDWAADKLMKRASYPSQDMLDAEAALAGASLTGPAAGGSVTGEVEP